MAHTLAGDLPTRPSAASLPYLLTIAAMALVGIIAAWVILDSTADRLDGRIADGRLPDYVAFYAAGKLVLDGRPGDVYDLEAIGAAESKITGRRIDGANSLPYLNPPFVAVAFAPLALLPLAAATLLLLALNLGLAAALGIALLRFLRPAGRRQRLFIALAYVSSYPVFAVLLQLQVSLLPLAAWSGFIYFQSRNRPGLSGLALSLGLVKPQLVVLALLYLVLRRHYAALIPFAAVAAALTALSVAVMGPGVLLDYPRFLLDSTSWHGNGISAFAMYGWNSLVASLSGDATPPAYLVALLILPTLALAARACWSVRLAGTPDRLLPLGGLLISAALLVNPHLYLHDLVLLCLVAVLGTAHSIRATGSAGAWPLIAVVLWFVMLPLPGSQVTGNLPIVTLATAALLLHFHRHLRQPLLTATPVTAAPSRLAA